MMPTSGTPGKLWRPFDFRSYQFVVAITKLLRCRSDFARAVKSPDETLRIANAGSAGFSVEPRRILVVVIIVRSATCGYVLPGSVTGRADRNTSCAVIIRCRK